MYIVQKGGLIINKKSRTQNFDPFVLNFWPDQSTFDPKLPVNFELSHGYTSTLFWSEELVHSTLDWTQECVNEQSKCFSQNRHQ